MESSISADGAVHKVRRQQDRGRSPDARGSQQAAIWLRGTEWRLLGRGSSPMPGPCDADLSIAIQVSGDGKVVVGLGWDTRSVARAFRWEESTGMVNLGSTVADRSSRADAVSGDGKVVVGFQEHTSGFWQGARWVDGQHDAVHGPAWLGRPGVRHEQRRLARRGAGVSSRRPTGSERVGVDPARRPAVPARPEAEALSREGDFLGRARATSEDGRV